MTFPLCTRRVALFATCTLLMSCGSGLATSILQGPDYDRYPPAARGFSVEVLQEAPPEKYAVVGFIEMRAARPRSLSTVLSELRKAGQRLEAHALIPRKAQKPQNDDTLNPMRAYFVRDDAQGQVIEALAIRFPPGAENP